MEGRLKLAVKNWWMMARDGHMAKDFKRSQGSILAVVLHMSLMMMMMIFLCTEPRCLHLFLCLKFSFYFSSQLFSVDPFHVVNSLLSYSSCNFLHPRISSYSLSSSS